MPGHRSAFTPNQVDDWNEATFLGAAVGILITVSLAAAAAVVLVLVRNRVGKLL